MKEMPNWLYWLMTPFMLLLAKPKPIVGLKKADVIARIFDMKSCGLDEKRKFIKIMKSEGEFVDVEECAKLANAVTDFFKMKQRQKSFAQAFSPKTRGDKEFSLILSECLDLLKLLMHKAPE